MENNIFIKSKKNKFNPDVEHKLKQKESERTTTTFSLSNNIYNPITSVVPEQVKTVDDLILDKDKTLTKEEFKMLMQQKELDRQNQDNTYKPVKTKVVNNAVTPVVPPVVPLVDSNVDKKNYIEIFEDLKRGSINSHSKVTKQNKNYDNILVGLKDLGIIK